MNSRTQSFIFIGIAVVIIISVLAFSGIFSGGGTTIPPISGTLEFWGFNGDENLWRDTITAFTEEHKGISVSYRELSEATFEERLVNALARGTGPDIFLLKNSWISTHRDLILPLPQQVFEYTTRDFETTFVDGVSETLIMPDGSILGLPLGIDTPALFYNKDIFNTAGIASPPKTWEDISALILKLTVKTRADDITESAIALGTHKNVEHFFEILTSLIFQYGDMLIDPATEDAPLTEKSAAAFAHFYSFADSRSPNFSWTDRKQKSLDAFANGQTAMAIGFARDIKRIQEKNPHLNLGIAPFPQRAGSRTPATDAVYLFPAISKQSKNPIAAWQFAFFISSQKGVQPYLLETNLAPARRDMIAAGSQNPDLSVFWRQALTARTWLNPDEQATRSLFARALDTIASRTETPEQAIVTLRNQLRLLIPSP